jgi:hypothetical protein
MKRATVLLAIALLAATATPQDKKHITLTENSSVASADIVRGLAKKCPNVSLTTDAARADYKLEAIRQLRDQDAEGSTWRYKLTLFDKTGAAVYATSTRSLDNAIKDVCSAINKKS